jgi:cytochrome P450
MIEAGSETTASALNAAWKYLAANPRVQEVAEKWLAAAVGESRSPTFDDLDNLQYIRAIFKEILRMRAPSKFGVIHTTTADCTYKNFFIPSGSNVMIAPMITHYDKRYEDPFEFKPERYLESTQRLGMSVAQSDPTLRDNFTFGAGRRICPGIHIAENSLYIVLAKVLWAFDIKAALGPDGKEEMLDLSDKAFGDGQISMPDPYRLRFIPKSKARADIIRQEWLAAERDGYWLGDIKVDKNGMLTKTTAAV